MEKIMKKIISCLLTFVICIFAIGCNAENDPVQNIDASDTVSASFDSVITITSREPLVGGERAVFKSTISASDIKLSDALEGKRVSSVTFIDQYTVKLTLTGKVTASFDDIDYGTITVSADALENDCDAFDVVIVQKAYVCATSSSSSSASGMYTATYTLSNGSFAEDISLEDVTLAEGSDGTLESVTLADGAVTVKVTGASDVPSVSFAADTTSFNKAFTIKMDSLAKVTVE